MSDLTVQQQIDASQALIDEAIEADDAARPDEPSLPFSQWIQKNLLLVDEGPLGILKGVFLTLFFGFIALLSYRAVLNFVFSENTNWDSVRINLRLLFTQAYPEEHYMRVWVSLGIVAVLSGLSLGLSKVGRGLSMKRLAMWCFSWGSLIVIGILLREPSVRNDADGNALFVDEDGVELVTNSLGSLAYANGDPAPSQGLEVVRQSFGAAMGDRTTWWIIGLVLLALGSAIWFGLGDFRRRNTFVPAIPLTLAGIAAFVSSTWWYKWGNYTFNAERVEEPFKYEPAELVASSTRNPWTVLVLVLIGTYLLGRLLSRGGQTGTVRALVNGSWLLAPLVTFYAILRGPILDSGHVIGTDIPLWALFTLGGALLLYLLTSPTIGELGRIIATAVILIAAFTWIGAFFGWFSMLQKVRLSILLLGLAALLAPNFIGETRQRLKLVFGWIGVSTIFHILVTLINTPSRIEVPTEDFAGGFMITIYVAVFTMIFSFPLGVLLALARTSRMPLFRVMSTVFIESVRGVPLITILFFFTTFINLFLPEGMELSLLAAVTVGFTLFSAAYLAENVRGGLQAIRQGQYEASDALGLTTVQRTGFIVLPQALRVSIPPLVGQTIATFKETSLLAIVGVFDFLRMARDVIPAQTEFLGERKPGLLFISAIYFIGAYAMSKYSQRLEKRLGVGER